jgi:Zinc dependent phospholipase C
MRLLVWLLFLGVFPCRAWDTLPHQRITKAALDTLLKQQLHRFGAEVKPLIEIYCIFPDRYEEMERFGFVRNSPGPRAASEIKPYCVRPDGQAIHGAAGDREMDTSSVVFLFERILTSLSDRRPGEAARYAGVLSHFIADSLSPPHSAVAEELLAVTPPSAQTERINVHSAIERSLPEFTLSDRVPRSAGGHLVQAAEAILDQCYAGAERNRKDLPSMVKAAFAHDEQTLNEYRLRAGTKAAEILADALYTLFTMGEDDQRKPAR